MTQLMFYALKLIEVRAEHTVLPTTSHELPISKLVSCPVIWKTYKINKLQKYSFQETYIIIALNNHKMGLI